ncbi:molybdopterin-dependent oxidoreductase [Lentisphaera profundi]|uniref:Molybdopterin-dependent oxidoreductase n=1 Tax=Lentisphaera profundi TaxID=1658616 RepID=A0ABY7VSL8_9BACT|nr:molybdopterin-dependent oxidoreductase [Lentisphaera profundi]WDE96248.1 molybdopterin-dependent oxidoreductase [Lentisphaera profundi]
MKRRSFIKGSAAMGAAAGVSGSKGWAVPGSDKIELEGKKCATNLLAACPYCGVGCGTIIQTKNGKITNILPDKDHPTNKGLQCIKGLTSAEAIYVNRLTKPLIRKDMSDPHTGHISKTKGSYDPKHFREATWEEADELITDKIVELVQEYGGNSIGLYGSGQLPVEGQYLENLFMKGVLGSNTIEANARMCMTSAVTGYFKALGSDTPPTCYDDIEISDMICFWGHNARGSHPILYWRVADHKSKNDIPTLCVDPRRTGTVAGLEEINPENSTHFPTINGDISIHNAIAYAIMEKHPEAVDWNLLKNHTTGWETYVEEVKKDYRPEDVIDRTMIPAEEIYALAATWAEASIKGKKRGQGGVLAFWGIGYNQHLHGQHNTMSLINLMALTGNIGRPGCGPHSQTGQPNAMGERLTGGLTGRLPFNIGLDDDKHRAVMAEAWGVPKARLDAVASAANPGMAVGMMERALKGEVKAMFMIYATHIDLPDAYNLSRPAMTKMFTVSQEIYKDAPNNLYSDIILPAATWGEWVGGTYVQSERRFYVCDGTANPVKGCRPDMDMVIDKIKSIGEKLGLDPKKIAPYERKENGYYDPEEVFRDFLKASKGTDADLTGILEVEKETGKSPYQQIRDLRGIQWPAPTAAIAKAGGTKRRYMGQESYWPDKPYAEFRHPDGKLHIHMCRQDYSNYKEVTDELKKLGTDPNYFAIDHLDVLVKARDAGLTPELPDKDFLGKKIGTVPKDKFPFWWATGVVYEHFHTAKTIRAGTTKKLVPEMYVEMHPEDAAELGVKDGQWVKVITRRNNPNDKNNEAYIEARVSIGLDSVVKPARNTVPKGFLFSPWNLSVADSADPAKNRWLANGTTHRAFDPVSGQADFKKNACRIEPLS